MSDLRLEQLVAAPDGCLYGLDEDGIVWYCTSLYAKWKRMPMLKEKES